QRRNMDRSLSKSPSRKVLEESIRRILMTETLQEGTNRHFKSAKDFMPFFESLYPATDALTKQVQRAIKAMDMPRDEKGYFIIDKTRAQLEKDKELSRMLQKTESEVVELSGLEVVFLKTSSSYKDYLRQLICESETLKDKYITVADSSNGLLFLTSNKHLLQSQLKKLEELS
ncbi:MAG: hypothetical protein K6G13_06955, partial [Agathobacter sp.]|uniref:hypothetical protein n=1 Tax=Agathobacter sp. TaxID=2021311 RepID=UPI002590CC67